MPVFSWRNLKGLAWAKYKLMFDLPEELPDLTLETMTPQQWELLADRCYMELDWCRLLQLRPDLADRCPWEKMDGCWSSLLQDLPQFADKCVWSKLSGSDWCNFAEASTVRQQVRLGPASLSRYRATARRRLENYFG